MGGTKSTGFQEDLQLVPMALELWAERANYGGNLLGHRRNHIRRSRGVHRQIVELWDAVLLASRKLYNLVYPKQRLLLAMENRGGFMLLTIARVLIQAGLFGSRFLCGLCFLSWPGLGALRLQILFTFGYLVMLFVTLHKRLVAIVDRHCSSNGLYTRWFLVNYIIDIYIIWLK